MLECYKSLLEQTRKNQLKYSRGYAILDKMNETLKIMKQKKNELVKPDQRKQTQIITNISYFLDNYNMKWTKKSRRRRNEV